MIEQTNIIFISYNYCNSIPKNIDIVRTLIGNCHILLLQEIILMDEDIGFLNEKIQ